MDPAKYYSYTLKQLDYIARSNMKGNEEKWRQTRNIEFAVYNSTIAPNGKSAFRMKKPSEVYRLPSDPENKVLTGKEAKSALAQLVKKK